MADNHYEVIVIGSGPGGASLAQRLSATGTRILLLERGEYLPRTRANWDAQTVFVEAAYQTRETWYGRDGRSFHPGLHYYVGGNSKVYGAALLRLRRRISRTCAMPMASHRPGRSPTPTSSPSMPRPSGCSTCTARAAKIRTNRPRAVRSLIRRSRTSRPSSR